MYPSIDLDYSSAVFSYNYYLSPAQTWASFGALSIVVNTPNYITESSLSGRQKTATGYTYAFAALPDGEFDFSMSEIENPVKNPDDGYDFWLSGSNLNNNSVLETVLICISSSLVVLAMACLIVGCTLHTRKKNNET